MVQMPGRSYSVYENIAVAAGAEVAIASQGEFFIVLASSLSTFLLGIDEGRFNVAKKGHKVRMSPGQDFHNLRIRNPNASGLVVDIATGFGDLSDNATEIDGAVRTAAGGDQFTYDGNVTVDLVAVELLPANVNRTGAIILAGGAPIWLGPDNTVAVAGNATVGANGSLSIQHQGAVWGIRGVAGTKAGVYEETN